MIHDRAALMPVALVAVILEVAQWWPRASFLGIRDILSLGIL